MRFNLNSHSNPQPIPQGVSGPEAVESFKDSTKQIDTLRIELKEKEHQYDSQFKQDFLKITNAFFNAVPRIKSITWTQYTPYHRKDGSCEFSITDVFFATEKNPHMEAYYVFKKDDDNFSDYFFNLKDLITSEECELCEKMLKIIEGNEELMKDIFGDHVLVVLRANGATTQEYDHE